MSNPLQDKFDNMFKKLEMPGFTQKQDVDICQDCGKAFPVLFLQPHFQVCPPRKDRLHPEWREED